MPFEVWAAIVCAAVGVCLFVKGVWFPSHDRERRRYRREMYRQQQASWHAQEEAWSRPSLTELVGANKKPHLRMVNGMWLHQTESEVGYGVTANGAYKDWWRKVSGRLNALK